MLGSSGAWPIPRLGCDCPQCTSPDPRDRTVKDHMPMTEGVECARRLKPGRTLFTHVGHRIGTHAELEAWVPEGFGVAYDGLDIELQARPA